ncbi:hypothetical protein VNO78_03631 [Psophocarpus tetragonolobus]|uniref:GTD-binding domain-containing protein n=1 Tax=Psophocarpus tetragonolobus TaxID=3891 RepID=A0AAN9TDK3_PSOTE
MCNGMENIVSEMVRCKLLRPLFLRLSIRSQFSPWLLITRIRSLSSRFAYKSDVGLTQTQMQTLSLLVAPVLGFYHSFFRFSIRFILLMFMDFPSTFNFVTQASELSCGFLLLGYFSRIFNLIGLLLIFLFCLKFLRSPLPSPSHSHTHTHTKDDDLHLSLPREDCFEDQMFDVMTLRRMVKAERHRYNTACAEIDKERGAAASAAEEAMAMILRLQSEKSSVEIQAKQFRRVVEQKQEYDLEVIESLRWTVLQLESQKNLLERQLGVLRERLKHFVDDLEIQHQLQQQDTPADVVDDHLDPDADSDSGFLNFSIEYDDVDASSSPNPSPSPSPSPSPTPTPQHL